MKKILLTGASGFIGSHVFQILDSYEVIVLTSPFSTNKRIKNIGVKNTLVVANLAIEKDVEDIFEKYKPEVVIHLATHGVYSYQQNDEKRIINDNYMMTFNLLNNSKKYGVKKFINTGSVFEYGSQRKEVKESDVNLDDILNQYSAVKMATTALACTYADFFSVITLRPFTAYGPGEDRSRFIRATIERALKNEPIRIVTGVIRDFVFVEDIASAYLKVLEDDRKISGEIFSIASGRKTTLDEVAKIIKQLSNSKSEIVVDNSYKRRKESACWADISKAKNILNWQPKFTLENGIQKTIDWVASNN